MPNTRVRLNIERRISFADGMSFGDVGPYERLVGTATYSVDPREPALQGIVDLDLAPLNRGGQVKFSGDVDIIKPVDLSKGNKRLFYEVSNRGNRSALRSFNDAAASPDPQSVEHAGNGFLMRNGYTVMWSGWQGDLVPGGGLITASLPEARDGGEPLRGSVRQEFIVDRAGVLSMPVSGAANIQCYPVLDASTATLTAREHELDPRQIVPTGDWQIAKAVKDATTGEVKVTPSNVDLYLKDGFKPGWIYELIYDTEGSRVMGLGLAGIRDLISFLRHEDVDANDTPNPLAGGVEKAYAYGGSLSARVVREFVHEGFNEDAEGRPVFDAVHSHLSGGGRVWVNQRFAQVGRFPRQHEEHQWASERYPFAYSEVPDLYSEKLDSVLKRPGTDPLVMHTHSATEYWQRHASTGQVDPRSDEDVEAPDTVRMYFLASFPHGAAVPGPGFIGEADPNGLAHGPFLRAALERMDRWTTDGTPPSPSRLPRRDEGTLVDAADALAHFPKLNGVILPKAPSRLPLWDFGPDFDTHGLLTVHPPASSPEREYPVFVPQVDADGNDAAGLRSPDIEVPVGTYTGWSIRREGFGGGDLNGLSGSFIPFARTKTDREAANDPRFSLEERYGNHETYVRAVEASVRGLVDAGLLLSEDGERFVASARARNPLDPSTKLGPLLAD